MTIPDGEVQGLWAWFATSEEFREASYEKQCAGVGAQMLGGCGGDQRLAGRESKRYADRFGMGTGTPWETDRRLIMFTLSMFCTYPETSWTGFYGRGSLMQ